MLSLIPCIIHKNLRKKSPDAARTSFTMIVAWCLYISCVHDSTMLWDLIDAPTTLHHVLSVCARSFTKIDHNTTRNVIGVWYDTPRPWHVLIPWSPDHVISHPIHLVIIAFHIHIIISMYDPCQFLEPIAPNPPFYSYWFSFIIPSIISSSFYTLSLSRSHLQNLEGKPRNICKIFLCPIDSSPFKVRPNFHSKSSFEFNEVNWIQIH
jgi:hypothetical protein